MAAISGGWMELGEHIKMTDAITTSREIAKWLDSLDIHIEVDEFAPVVCECKVTDYAEKEEKTCFLVKTKRDANDKFLTGLGGLTEIETKILCPFFGSADNSLKALRAWCRYMKEKQGQEVELVYGLSRAIHWWVAPFSDLAEQDYFGAGKTDGEALLALLVKLKEASK